MNAARFRMNYMHWSSGGRDNVTQASFLLISSKMDVDIIASVTSTKVTRSSNDHDGFKLIFLAIVLMLQVHILIIKNSSHHIVHQHHTSRSHILLL